MTNSIEHRLAALSRRVPNGIRPVELVLSEHTRRRRRVHTATVGLGLLTVAVVGTWVATRQSTSQHSPSSVSTSEPVPTFGDILKPQPESGLYAMDTVGGTSLKLKLSPDAYQTLGTLRIAASARLGCSDDGRYCGDGEALITSRETADPISGPQSKYGDAEYGLRRGTPILRWTSQNWVMDVPTFNISATDLATWSLGIGLSDTGTGQLPHPSLGVGSPLSILPEDGSVLSLYGNDAKGNEVNARFIFSQGPCDPSRDYLGPFEGSAGLQLCFPSARVTLSASGSSETMRSIQSELIVESRTRASASAGQ